MATSCQRAVKCQHRMYKRYTSSLHHMFGSIRQFHSTPSAVGPPDFNKIFLKRASMFISQIFLTIRTEAKERVTERQEEERRKREATKSAKAIGAKAIADKLKEERKVFFRGNPDAKFVFIPELELRHLLYAERHVGEVVSFPEVAIEQLDTLEMLNGRYGFQYMRKPAGLIRPNTGLVARQLLSQDVSHLGTKDRRIIIAGKGGTGKSFMLLQITAMALMQKYVVIAVPCGISD
jgi:Mitochondrial ribosomal death-associated protein 3